MTILSFEENCTPTMHDEMKPATFEKAGLHIHVTNISDYYSFLIITHIFLLFTHYSYFDQGTIVQNLTLSIICRINQIKTLILYLIVVFQVQGSLP